MVSKITIAILLLPALTGAAIARDTSDPYEQFRAETDRSEFEFDQSLVEPWKEQTSKPPVLDLDALRRLEIDHGPIDATVHVDESSVDVNMKDRVVRYWMVLRNNDGGFGSMSFEGLRCNTMDYKIYAYSSAARPGTVKPVRSPQWRPIRQNTRDPHFEMARDYFCAGVVPRTAESVVHSLKGHGNLNPAASLTDLNTLLDN